MKPSLRRAALLLAGLLLVPSAVQAQLTVRGHVRDQQGQPLPGAQVVVVGIRLGTVTGSDGAYTLRIPQADQETVLQALYIGYRAQSQTVRQATGAATVDFTLGIDVMRLDEVVVTGTSAATSRRQLGNAISTITAADLAASASPAIDRALSGKVAGALVQQNSGNPAGGISVRLRGTGTILGAADPLYIIDGVIVNNDSPELLYLGGYAQNRLVDLNPADVERIEIVKGAAAAALYGSRANNGVIQIFTKRGQVGQPRVVVSSNFTTDALRKRLEVNQHPFDAQGNPVTRYDHQDVIFRRASGTNSNVQVSGGTEGTQYFFSGSLLKNEGIIRGVDFQRVSARLRIDQDITNWARVSLGGVYSVSDNNERPSGGLGALYGVLDGFIFGPNTYDARRDPATGLYSSAGAFANPAEVIDRYEFAQTTNRFIGDIRLSLTPLASVEVEYVAGYDGYTQAATGYIPRGVATPGIYQFGWSRKASRESVQSNHDLNIRHRHRAGNVEFSTLLAGTWQVERPTTMSMWSYDLSPVTRIATGGANHNMSEYRSERRIGGLFAQETINFGDRLFLTAGGRVDASSVFSPEHRWQFYPKASASYVISDAGFWEDTWASRIFPTFKIRTAWGQSGGLTAIGAYDRLTLYSTTSYDGKPGLLPGTQQGGNIKPERQSELEVGVDLSLLSDRLAVEATWYDSETTDVLLTRQIALSTGFSTRLENMGTLTNRGFEVLVRALPIYRPGLSWTTTFNYAANRNEVSGIEGDLRILAESWGLAGAINGQPLGVYYGWGYARDDQGNKLATDGTPYTDPRTQVPARSPDRSIVGDPNPDFIAAWTNELNIGRNWSFRAQLDAVQGNDIWNYTRRIGAYPPYGTLKDYERELRGEVAAGTGNALWLNFEHWVEDGSFVKLRELSATYQFQPGRLGVRDLALTFAGRNLFSLDNYTGYDPEVNTGGQRTGTRGYEFIEVPLPRSVSFGVTATF
jgi:TonB-dependent starch-binding outer membrane protein SusC